MRIDVTSSTIATLSHSEPSEPEEADVIYDLDCAVIVGVSGVDLTAGELDLNAAHFAPVIAWGILTSTSADDPKFSAHKASMCVARDLKLSRYFLEPAVGKSDTVRGATYIPLAQTTDRPKHDLYGYVFSTETRAAEPRNFNSTLLETLRRFYAQVRRGNEGVRKSLAPLLPANRAGDALKGFFGIMERWNVDDETARVILGWPSKQQYEAWKAGKVGDVSYDTLQRIGYVAGIFKALEILYTEPHLADTWVRRPNRAFGGQRPLDRMAAGDITDLDVVRRYVDAARAPWS